MIHTTTRKCNMLVLSRKIHERIHIGDNIVITIVSIDRGKIRLGIECPREIIIMREELLTAQTPAELEKV